MRTLILVVVLVAACKGKDKAAQEAAKAALAAPKVEVATVLAKETDKLPFLLVVDDAGVRVAAAASWAELDAGELKITKRPGSLDDIDLFLRETFALGKQPIDAVATLDDDSESGVQIDLASLEDTTARANTLAQDDPPPPEEEDKPDDGADESGGVGTAMALEEGKMGKKDSDRAEGQYKMRKNQEDPQLARQQAIEQARAAGILGNGGSTKRGFGPGVRANDDGLPSRLSEVQGAVIENGKLEPLRTLILMAPTAKATKLIDVVRVTEGAIAVTHAGKIRPLRLQFMSRDTASAPQVWLEARVSMKGLVIEAVPDRTIDVADLKQLAVALDKARSTRGADNTAPVDVLVDKDVDVQRMIDVIVALDMAGVRAIGLGSAPNTDDLLRRGHRIPTVALGQPSSQGELDKVIIRRFIRAAKRQILECYARALATKPDLEGTVSAQFFINPSGSVASATASGVHPDVANCVADIIKRIEFPKPTSGGVQVSYPFTMRP